MEDNKDLVKETLVRGIFGAPGIKIDEKKEYLGQFKENVIAVVRGKNSGDIEVIPFLKKMAKEYGGQFIILSNDVGQEVYGKFLKEFKDQGIDIRLYKNEDSNTNIRILLGSKNTLDLKGGPIEYKSKLPDKFKKAKSNYLCVECYKELEKIEPGLLDDYKLIGTFEKMTGIKCGVCQDVDNGPLI